MTGHLDVLALLRGELPNATAVEAGAHLDACALCRTELAGLAGAHAMLTRSARVLGAPEQGSALPPLPDPSRSRRTPPPTAGTPSSRTPSSRTATTRTRRRALGVLVAAVVVAAGVVGTTQLLDRPDVRPPTARVSAPLDAVAGGAGGRLVMAVATGHSTRMTLTTTGLPPIADDRFYEAWLLDPLTRKMLPLGQLGPSGRATFEIDDALLGRYSVVDVSLERDDGDPAHSVLSVLRAAYADPPIAS